MKIFNLKPHITNPPTSPRLPTSLKFRRTRRRVKVVSSAFTIVEMLIVAPIVILVIGVFVTAIINMTGDVLATRAYNALAYNTQDALNLIEQDVKLSSALLATNNIALSSPQGYDNGTGIFKNADATNGTMLILNAYTTTSNPLVSTRNLVYMSNQSNACGSAQVNQNLPLMMNIVYFVKNSTLWRRVVMAPNYTTVGCTVPWQQPTCAPGISGTLCKTQDIRLVDGIASGGFSVNYYPTSSSTIANATASNSASSDSARQTALLANSTVGVTITAANTTAGRDISQSGTIRSVSSNRIIYPSCLAILNAGLSTGSGIYWIYPTGPLGFQAYCDMQNGGWTRLNSNIANSTKPFDSNDVITTNNVPGVCGSPGCPLTINSISVAYTNVKVDLTRTTSIIQCAGLSGISTSTTYWNGSTWINNTMCTWSDGIFANSTSTNMSGLKLLWELKGPKVASGAIQLISQCSDGTDNGQIQVTAWVQ